MSKGALALLIRGTTQNWSAKRWKARFDQVCSDRGVLQLPGATFDPANVRYAAVWKPVPGELAALPNLKVIFNLGPASMRCWPIQHCRTFRWCAWRSTT